MFKIRRDITSTIRNIAYLCPGMKTHRKLPYHLAALFTVAVWGTTFVSTKVLIGNGMTPAEIFFLRFALAYAAIWLIAPRRLWADSWQDEARLAAAGLCGGSLYFLTENTALEISPASNVALIVCTAPLWTALLASLRDRSERMSRRQTVGVTAAFAGVVLVVCNGQFVLQLSPRGDLLALAAALCWVGYSLLMKRIGANYPTLFITRKVFFYGLLTILPALCIAPPTFDPARLAQPVVWGNLLFLGLIASMLCYVLWNTALRHLGVVRTTNYGYLNPLTTMLAASLCIDERITPIALLGATLILAGMWIAERE